jgi:hypothetical protein
MAAAAAALFMSDGRHRPTRTPTATNCSAITLIDIERLLFCHCFDVEAVVAGRLPPPPIKREEIVEMRLVGRS